MEKVKIQSTKGKLAAVIHQPDQKTDKLAILCPGFLDSKDYNHLVLLADALAKHGCTVVRFDPTGTWESQGDISEYTDTQYLKDIQSVLEYMLQKEKFDYILLGGHSRGGQVSILYAARDPRISVVLSIMPSTPYSRPKQRREDWQRDGFRLSPRDIPGTTEKRKYRVPYSLQIDRDKYNVVAEVKKVHVPIILLTGELDTIVLPEQVKLIFDNANEPKKFILMPSIGHDYRHNLDEIEKVNERIIKELQF